MSMNYTPKVVIILILLIVMFGSFMGAFFYQKKLISDDEFVPKVYGAYETDLNVNTKTKGNYTVIKFKNKYSFDISSVPEILNRFENEHKNLIIKQVDIIYNDPLGSLPHGILIWHAIKTQ